MQCHVQDVSRHFPKQAGNLVTKWACLITDAWTISVQVWNTLYNLKVVPENPPCFANGLGFMAPINSNNILIYSYQIWVVSSVHVGKHAQLLKREMPPSCIPFVSRKYKEKKGNICWLSMLPFNRSALDCKIDQTTTNRTVRHDHSIQSMRQKVSHWRGWLQMNSLWDCGC